MARSKSSADWLKEHFNDEYVQLSQKEGYRSRAVYKLIELQDKYNIINPGDTVVELGAAPGSWTQYIAKLVGKKGQVIALDLLQMNPIPGVTLIQGDFMDDMVYQELLEQEGSNGINCILSDMRENTTGVEKVDQLKAMHLSECIVDFAMTSLSNGGRLLFKAFQGPGFDNLLSDLKKNFSKVSVRKPDASRSRSKELFILAVGYSGKT